MGGDFPRMRLTAEAKAQAYVMDEIPNMLIYESRQTASPNLVTHVRTCMYCTYMSIAYIKRQKKNRRDTTRHPDHLFVNRDFRVLFRLHRTSSPRQVGAPGQVPQRRGNNLVKLSVFGVELFQNEAPCLANVLGAIKQPVPQRHPSHRRVLFVVVHLLRHVVNTSGQGLSVRPYVPAHARMNMQEHSYMITHI